MARVYLVGTDTAVGKTTIACVLLAAARRAGLTWIPFKPAQTGPDDPSDAVRLTTAAGLPSEQAPRVGPWSWPQPVAPGIAEDPARFLDEHRVPDPTILPRARVLLAELQTDHDADVAIIEGAGGLYVPMPGGTWQPDWIVALATHAVVIGRAGLGTIHHTLAAIAGLRAIGRPPLGFVLNAIAPPDPSNASNAAVIAARSGVPCLAIVPPDPTPEVADALLAALTSAIAR